MLLCSACLLCSGARIHRDHNRLLDLIVPCVYLMVAGVVMHQYIHDFLGNTCGKIYNTCLHDITTVSSDERNHKCASQWHHNVATLILVSKNQASTMAQL